MKRQSERVSRIWCAVSIAASALLIALPEAWKPSGVVSLLNALIGILIFLAVGGFYIRMLLECIFARDVANRGLWLTLFLFLPISSA